MHALRRGAPFALPCSPVNCRRRLSSLTSQNLSELDEWIASPKHTVLQDTLHPERVADLYITLPTRNGVTKPFRYPRLSRTLGYGHHMAFFHPLAPENQLRPDGTEGDFCPPEPFTRRMWAGGKIVWNPKDPLRVGEKATATWSVDSVEKKGFEKGNPMLFVNKKIEYTMIGKAHPSVVEERSHVYLSRPQARSGPREVKDIPTEKDFSFSYTPTLTTLFRFSALTWNAHHIHLDKDYAHHEGYSERLVHGPLTALILLENITYHQPHAKIRKFEYRARNPLVVGRPLSIHAHQKDEVTFRVWCEDELDGFVGMTGEVVIEPIPEEGRPRETESGVQI